jgi:hypothetical protein
VRIKPIHHIARLNRRIGRTRGTWLIHLLRLRAVNNRSRMLNLLPVPDPLLRQGWDFVRTTAVRRSSSIVRRMTPLTPTTSDGDTLQGYRSSTIRRFIDAIGYRAVGLPIIKVTYGYIMFRFSPKWSNPRGSLVGSLAWRVYPVASAPKV